MLWHIFYRPMSVNIKSFSQYIMTCQDSRILFSALGVVHSIVRILALGRVFPV